ncbi:glycoside hydrolase family 43 protein [Pedococcus sp. 5OH_020]|uniref:glycoside hydrolase family 43 protein n=1 Tax=Pedococcus sp. 5OH_020 TaxID=2989814 RepID=UPI0022E9B0A8|nr:glycoside hydrolase family 43 protein [Pedococcus sp. 5OH_020]
MSARSGHTPIVAGFYPDPTICRVGDDYYLAQSSFEYFPGVPLWHSRDLLRWKQVGHILTRRSQFLRGDGRPSTGVYAGTLRHHEGRFCYVTTNVSDYESGQILLTADDPAGPWSDPVRVPQAIGIDPDLAWHDGECYLTWKAMSFTEGERGILQARLDVTTGDLAEPPYPVWQGSGLAMPEGPHLYKIGDYWYLLLAEGGTERGHAVTIARGSTPAGPFDGCPENPILSHRSSIHPTQNIGHADLVRTPDGGWAAVYLGARPRGSTPGFHVLGRETFLASVEWAQGWPVVLEDAFEIPRATTEWVDTFDDPDLDLRWVVPGGEPEAIVERPTPGVLRILPAPDRPPDGGGLLCARVRDLRWSAEARLEGSGRFLLRLDHRHSYGLTHHDGMVQATARIGDLDVVVGTAAVVGDVVVLRIAAVGPQSPPVPLGHGGPDDITLSLLTAEGVLELARLDGRYLSTEVASGFTGRTLALGSTAAPAHFRSVAYRPQP